MRSEVFVVFGFVKKWRERWSDYVGDHDLELKIRTVIAQHGLPRTSRIRRVRIAAIERPGWIQVYTFGIDSSVDGTLVQRWGIARHDGRRGTEVELFTTEFEREQRYEQWSEGMIRSPTRRRKR